MCRDDIAVKAVHRGFCPQGSPALLWGIALASILDVARVQPALAQPAASPAIAQVATATPPPATVPPPHALPPSGDLDGTYLWLGPIGAASRVAAQWDSTFGGDAALLVVREGSRLGAIGVDVGASRWTARGGGRVWVDGILGTRIAGSMMGVSLGPILELSDLAHPRPGASIGVWGFLGITPFARIGEVRALGMFAEIGVHIALPVLRR
jgi:hypothetical protein